MLGERFSDEPFRRGQHGHLSLSSTFFIQAELFWEPPYWALYFTYKSFGKNWFRDIDPKAVEESSCQCSKLPGTTFREGLACCRIPTPSQCLAYTRGWKHWWMKEWMHGRMGGGKGESYKWQTAPILTKCWNILSHLDCRLNVWWVNKGGKSKQVNKHNP